MNVAQVVTHKILRNDGRSLRFMQQKHSHMLFGQLDLRILEGSSQLVSCQQLW